MDSSRVTVKTLQRLVEKCVSFSLAVPAARLFTKQINSAIAKGQRSRNKLIPLRAVYMKKSLIGCSWRTGTTRYLGEMRAIYVCLLLQMRLRQDGAVPCYEIY